MLQNQTNVLICPVACPVIILRLHYFQHSPEPFRMCNIVLILRQIYWVSVTKLLGVWCVLWPPWRRVWETQWPQTPVVATWETLTMFHVSLLHSMHHLTKLASKDNRKYFCKIWNEKMEWKEFVPASDYRKTWHWIWYLYAGATVPPCQLGFTHLNTWSCHHQTGGAVYPTSLLPAQFSYLVKWFYEVQMNVNLQWLEDFLNTQNMKNYNFLKNRLRMLEFYNSSFHAIVKDEDWKLAPFFSWVFLSN